MKYHHQSGTFYQGTSGFPLRIALGNLSADDLASITSAQLVFQRPDFSEFSHTATPDDIIDGALQYVFGEGDLSMGGGYRYKIILNLSGGRVLPSGGFFDVKPVIPTTGS